MTPDPALPHEVPPRYRCSREDLKLKEERIRGICIAGAGLLVAGAIWYLMGLSHVELVFLSAFLILAATVYLQRKLDWEKEDLKKSGEVLKPDLTDPEKIAFSHGFIWAGIIMLSAAGVWELVSGGLGAGVPMAIVGLLVYLIGVALEWRAMHPKIRVCQPVGNHG